MGWSGRTRGNGVDLKNKWQCVLDKVKTCHMNIKPGQQKTIPDEPDNS